MRTLRMITARGGSRALDEDAADDHACSCGAALLQLYVVQRRVQALDVDAADGRAVLLWSCGSDLYLVQWGGASVGWRGRCGCGGTLRMTTRCCCGAEPAVGDHVVLLWSCRSAIVCTLRMSGGTPRMTARCCRLILLFTAPQQGIPPSPPAFDSSLRRLRFRWQGPDCSCGGRIWKSRQNMPKCPAGIFWLK